MELYLRVRPGHERPEQGEAGRVASWQLGSGVRDLYAGGVGFSLEPQLGLSVATAVTFLLQERHLPGYCCSQALPIFFFACFVSCCIT